MMNKCEVVVCPIPVSKGDGPLNYMFRSCLPNYYQNMDIVE